MELEDTFANIHQHSDPTLGSMCFLFFSNGISFIEVSRWLSCFALYNPSPSLWISETARELGLPSCLFPDLGLGLSFLFPSQNLVKLLSMVSGVFTSAFISSGARQDFQKAKVRKPTPCTHLKHYSTFYK